MLTIVYGRERELDDDGLRERELGDDGLREIV